MVKRVSDYTIRNVVLQRLYKHQGATGFNSLWTFSILEFKLASDSKIWIKGVFGK